MIPGLGPLCYIDGCTNPRYAYAPYCHEHGEGGPRPAPWLDPRRSRCLAPLRCYCVRCRPQSRIAQLMLGPHPDANVIRLQLAARRAARQALP